MKKLSINNIKSETRINNSKLINRLVSKNIKGGALGCPPPSVTDLNN